jgi:CspA family cold shock protein
MGKAGQQWTASPTSSVEFPNLQPTLPRGANIRAVFLRPTRPSFTRALDVVFRRLVMATGTIKRLQRDKGFGFIRDGAGQDFFFHRSSVQGDFDGLREGQRVNFEEEPSPKGLRAGNVRPE